MAVLAKPESKEAPAAADKSAAPAGDKNAPADKPAAPASEARSKSGLITWVAALGAVVLAPALSFAVTQFVLLPRIEKKLAAPMPAAADSGAADGATTDSKIKNAPPTYNFDNVVVNLSGTMGTRYLKASFVVSGPAPDLAAVFESNKARLTDVTLNVLSALTLADLEEPGARNVLREKLVAAYNQALNRKVADQVYFSDFVVQ